MRPSLFLYPMHHGKLPEVNSFITDDEIDETLRGGGNVEGGRGRIYDFFSENHIQQEKIKFLKEEYGIGGHSHALSGSDGSFEDYSGKGIRFRKDGCTEIQMSWNNVAKRIAEIIRADRYFTPEAKRQYEAAKRRKQFDRLYGEYHTVKEAHPDDMVLFQVGAFFEMFGEDAKAAAEILDIHLAQREIKDVGKVEFCGIPTFSVEANIEKLRDKYDVTVSAIDAKTEQRGVYSLQSVDREAERDIDEHEAEYGADGTRVFRDEPQNTDVGGLLAQHKPTVISAVTEDVHYRNACGHSDRENAVLEGNAAVRRAVLNSGDMELIRLFSDMPKKNMA